MLLLSMLLGLIVLALFAGIFVVAAWRVSARYGPRSLVGIWLAGAAVFCLLNFVRFRAQGFPLHFPPASAADRIAIYGMLGNGLVGCGLAALSVRKRRRRSADGVLTRGAVAAGVGAFFAGMLIVLLVVAINDFSGVFVRIAR